MDNKLKKVVSAIVKDFLKKNKRNPKDDKELALFVQSQGGDKYIKRKTQEVLGGQTQEQELTPEQKQKAAHGAKLNYLKSLKHKCAEDEEVYYYKKGGSVGCGCKKKEDGDEMKPKKDCGGGPVAKFKKMRKGDKVVNGSTKLPMLNAMAKQEAERKAKRERERKSLEDYERGTYGNSDNPPDSKGMSLEYIKKQESKKVSSGRGYHIIMADKCGAKAVLKFKKHRLGGSLNGIPFYLGGTSKRGITEKSDNTRVQKILNKGEGVYEEIPVNGWNFVPIVGTLKEAKMLDQGDPNASVTRLGISLAGDLAGAGMIGSVAKASGKVGRIQKALKARGYQLFTEDGSLWFRLPKKIIRGYGDKLYTYEIPNIYGGSSFKTIPTVDYTPAVMAPLVLTLRVPAEAPFFNYSK